MFDSLSDKLQGIFKNLRGFGKLTEKNVADALREVRLAQLEADGGRAARNGGCYTKRKLDDGGVARVRQDDYVREIGEVAGEAGTQAAARCVRCLSTCGD